MSFSLPKTAEAARCGTTRRAASGCALLAALVLGGCAPIRQNQADFDGVRLLRAGFAVESPDTRAGAQPAAPLPPLQVQPLREDGRLIYVYADPYRCQCLYVGDQRAYARYRQLVENDFLDALLSIVQL